MLFLDGVYLTGTKPPVFRRIAPLSATELQALVHRIAERIGRALERQGLLIRDCETSYLTLDPADDSAMNDLLGHSITYRVGWRWVSGSKNSHIVTLVERQSRFTSLIKVGARRPPAS